MELYDSPNDRDGLPKKSQDAGPQTPRGNGSKLHAEHNRTQPAQPEIDQAPADEAHESDELEEILASIFDMPPQRSVRKPVSREQRAADVVARSGHLASTGATFREYARRLTRYLGSDPEADTPPGQLAGADVASLSLLEESSLIHAMFRAASRAGNEKEAGVLAVTSIPLLVQQYPRVSRALWTAIPALCLGVEGLTRFLHRSETTRPLIADLPRLLRRALDRLAQQVLQGQSLRSEAVSILLADQTGRWLASHLRPGWQRSASHFRTQRPLADEE